MKRFFVGWVVVTLVIAIVGGSGMTFAAEDHAQSANPALQDDLRIGLVTDVGRIDDGSFNQSAWEGVQMAGEEFGAEVDFIETTDPSDYANNIAEFAEDDFDIIVTVGFALAEATIEASANYPDIHFIGVDQFQAETIDNVTGLIFPEDKSGFLAGVLAASLTESGTIAAVLGTDLVPPVVAFKEGYERGAQWAADFWDRDISLISTYHPGGLDTAFTDPQWGAATARQALDQGADVIFAAGGQTGNGGLIEVASAAADGNPPYCIGVDTDQWLTVEEAHPCLVSSAQKNIASGIVDLVRAYDAGTIAGGNYVGDVGLASFHDFADDIPEDILSLIDRAERGLRTGAIQTCYNFDLSGLRLGLVTDVGRIDDGSFNQSAWGGLLAVQPCGAEIDFIETQDPSDYADNIAEFAEDDYDIIVTVGFALQEATIEAAADYPNIRFIGVDQFFGEPVEGVTGLVFPEDQSGFLAGVLAANLTETNTIAAVLGTDLVPPVVAFKEGYELGAQFVNPDINIISTYHPGGLDTAFTDPQWGAATARQALDQGADVVFAAGGQTGNGGLIEVAAAAADGNPPYCIGVDTDQWLTVEEAHPCLVSSAVKIIDGGIATLVNQYNAGMIEDGNFVGEVGLAPFHDFEDQISEELKAELQLLGQQLASGALTTGYTP
jgi:basic membrane lipoprotein Med (substrate-binding protein (PBP1-ABC) superfamily)